MKSAHEWPICVAWECSQSFEKENWNKGYKTGDTEIWRLQVVVMRANCTRPIMMVCIKGALSNSSLCDVTQSCDEEVTAAATRIFMHHCFPSKIDDSWLVNDIAVIQMPSAFALSNNI